MKFCCDTSLPFLNNSKYLDLSYKTDIDFGTVLQGNKSPSYNQRNMDPPSPILKYSASLELWIANTSDKMIPSDFQGSYRNKKTKFQDFSRTFYIISTVHFSLTVTHLILLNAGFLSHLGW